MLAFDLQTQKNPDKQEFLFYDPKLTFRFIIILITFFLACKVTGGLVFPLVIPFSIYYIRKQRFDFLFFILLLLITSIVCNPFFMPKPMFFTFSVRGLLVLFGFLVPSIPIVHQSLKPLKAIYTILYYAVYMVVVSFVGWAPVISLLKLFLFFSCFLAFYFVARGISQQKYEISKLRSMVLAVVSLLIIGSVLVTLFPAISYYTGRVQESISLYQGMTNQPQCLGIVAVMCEIILLGDVIFSLQRFDKFYSVLLLLAPYLVYKTSSRTAMGALVSGILFCVWCMTKNHFQKRNWKIKLRNTLLLLCAFVSIFVFTVPSLQDNIRHYLLKFEAQNERKEVSYDNVLSSRQAAFDRALDNWRKSPVIGNGFQVSEWMGKLEINSLANLFTAPVEKSTWVYAILEEGGLIGECLFCFLAIYIIFVLVNCHSYIGASCFFTMLVVNLGEFSMFSFSGVGAFVWGIVFIGCIFDIRRNVVQISRGNVQLPVAYFYEKQKGIEL